MNNIGTAQQRILGVLADRPRNSMSLWQLKAALWGTRRYYRHFARHSISKTRLQPGDAANLNRSLDGLCKRDLIDEGDWQRRRITLTPEGLQAHQVMHGCESLPIDTMLSLAAKRGSLRGHGLPRPKGLPSAGWYSVQQRRSHRYLYWRWKDESRIRSTCLGRLVT